jgi:hypothetical protein
MSLWLVWFLAGVLLMDVRVTQLLVRCLEEKYIAKNMSNRANSPIHIPDANYVTQRHFTLKCEKDYLNIVRYTPQKDSLTLWKANAVLVA